MMPVLTFSLLLVLCLASCNKHENHEDSHEVEISESYIDTHIPKQLWEKMEEVDPNEKGSKQKSYKLSSVKLILHEKNSDVLKKSHTIFSLTRGGNVFDLQDLVGATKGTFFLQFDLPEELQDPNTKIYFISNSKKRRIGEEIIGSGCGKYFDLSKNFSTHFVKKAFPVNTTKDRHVSTLAGTFLFVLKKDDQILLAQTSFTDSKMTHLLCEGFAL